MEFKKRGRFFMVELLVLSLILSPIAIVLVKAFIDSKDYYDYDKKKLRYVSRINK